MSEELPPSPDNGEPNSPSRADEVGNTPRGGGGSAEDKGATLPPRADRDRFGTLAKNVADPDRSCLTCVVLFLGGVLLLIGCLVYYYYANAAFHQP